jgi:hypothetical protein
MKFHTDHQKLIGILVVINIIFTPLFFIKHVNSYNGITVIGEIEVYDSDGISPLTSYDFPLFSGGTSDTFHKHFFIKNTGNQPVSVYWNISESSINWNLKKSLNLYKYYENGVCKYSFGIPQESLLTTDYWQPNTEALFLGVDDGKNLHFELFYTGETISSETFRLTISFYAKEPSTVPATVNVESDTLNLKSKGKWITSYVELPEGYEVNDIDFTSIMLNDTISVDTSAPITIRDYNKNGVADLLVKFNKNQIIEWLYTLFFSDETIFPPEVTFSVTGDLKEVTFEGYDTITINT